MRFSSIKYYLQEGFSGMLKNRLMTIASIATVAACFFIVTFSYCVMDNLDYFLQQIEEKVGVVAFLDEDVTSEEILTISEDISNIDHVKLATYVSPQEALEEMKEQLGAEEILAGFDEETNPLSHSFEIELDNIENQSAVVSALEQVPGVRKVNHAQSETEILLKINSAVKVAGVAAILVLALISIVIIMNTIKLSVFTRRYEINIMKFVGATDWFIRWPFLIEGMLIGFIGAVIPMVICWPLYGKLIDMIATSLPALTNIVEFRFPIDIFGKLVPGSLIGGMLLGILGSVSSIRKHLKV